MLEIRDLHVNYGAISALHGISLRVEWTLMRPFRLQTAPAILFVRLSSSKKTPSRARE